ncbi:MAG: hypothetical protein PVS2B2_24660 [Candidatus Acidiferrum sp.]
MSDGFRAGKRRKRAAGAWIPAPADQIVVGDMIEELLKVAAASLLGIFELAAELRGGTADERHFVFGTGERPFGISRR